MGLHRDPTHYTSSPIEIHIRRLIWYQICFLDLRTCEATGPRPQIRRDDYDTQLPLNVDDVDLSEMEASGRGTGEGRSYFTDMTITRMRFECYEMHRIIWAERAKFEAKRTTLTSLLSKVKNFTKAMEANYLPMLERSQPLHVLAMQIYGILSSRMYVMVLQRFISNARRLMPARLRQITISCSVLVRCILSSLITFTNLFLKVLEHSMVIEQTPALADWAWYVGALHQNHTSLLLLSEFYASKDVDPLVEARVWRCLDFVFDLPAAMSGQAKTRILLEELKGRIDEYHRVRRVRVPTKMGHAGAGVDGAESQQHQDEQRSRESRSQSVQSADSSEYTLSSASSMQHAQRQVIGGAMPQDYRTMSGTQPSIAQTFSTLR